MEGEDEPLVIQNKDSESKSKKFENDDIEEHVRIHLLGIEPTKFLWYYKYGNISLIPLAK